MQIQYKIQVIFILILQVFKYKKEGVFQPSSNIKDNSTFLRIQATNYSVFYNYHDNFEGCNILFSFPFYQSNKNLYHAAYRIRMPHPPTIF